MTKPPQRRHGLVFSPFISWRWRFSTCSPSQSAWQSTDQRDGLFDGAFPMACEGCQTMTSPPCTCLCHQESNMLFV